MVKFRLRAVKSVTVMLMSTLSLCSYYLPAVKAADAMETITSRPGERTELWQGKVLTATFRVGMCFADNGYARGVLLLKHSNGQEDVYHLQGQLRDNHFELAHSSGHFFAGELTGPGSMEGKAKLKNGPSLTLKGDRFQNVRLMAEDCAPLPK